MSGTSDSHRQQDIPLEPIEVLSAQADHSEQSVSLEREVHFGNSDSEEEVSGEQEVTSTRSTPRMEPVRIQYMSVRNWINVILLGLGFLLLFTSFQTSAFVQVSPIPSFLRVSHAVGERESRQFRVGILCLFALISTV